MGIEGDMLMKSHHLPDSDLQVSTLCFGAGNFGTTVVDERLEQLVRLFLDAGGNFFDTAHCYGFWYPGGDGASEMSLGEIVRRLRVHERVVIATKGGHPAIDPGYPRPDAFISPTRIAADLDDSLERLKMDNVGLYYLHYDDARLPVDEIIEMLNAEIARGRIRALGASNWRTERIAAANAYATAHGLRGFSVSQPQWSLAQFNHQSGPDPTQRALTPPDIRWHEETRLPAAPYSATGCGYFGANQPAAEGQFDNPVSRARRERARQLAAELGCTPHQVALAYLLCQDFPVIPIFSSSNPDHLAETLAATAVTLTLEQRRWLAEG